MKVLWFTNIPMPEMMGYKNNAHAASGGWMISLLEQLANIPDLELTIACAAPGLPDQEILVSKNLRYRSISQGPVWRLFGFHNLDNDPRYLNICAEIANDISPDIIHIHGSERFYGLLGSHKLVSAPVVISIQGLLQEYARLKHYFGVIPMKDIIAMHDLPHLIRGMGPWIGYLQIRNSAQRELKIIQGNRWFMGRTDWDRAHLTAINPAAHYFFVSEMLRPSFFSFEWTHEFCIPYRIIFTNANGYHRGVEVLLDAMAILKPQFPDICLALAGGVEVSLYGKQLQNRVERHGLQANVEYLGKLNETQMADELQKSNLFVIPSLLENSPNSLCEAQLVGMPCVATFTGGMPSLVKDGQTGLLFPAGDAPVLAEKIKDIFLDAQFASNLGKNAREAALVRHNPITITKSLLAAYQTVLLENAALFKE